MATRTRRVPAASVILWGNEVGAVAWDSDRAIGSFEYDPAYGREGSDVAPLTMPRRAGIFSFPALQRDTFHGLPGLLADALPDRYGNRLIDVWLARQGRSIADFTPVERLCYMGTRAMGALEFKPAIGPRAGSATPIDIADIAELASEVLRHRQAWAVRLSGPKGDALNDIIRIGTSAGGNRAKAVIAWNPATNEVRSGQVAAPAGFQPWILKLDGIADAALGNPTGFGRVEYAYHRMAIAAGIDMTPCRLLEEGGRAHFMTRRFDRDSDDGHKIHVQSLCAIAHFDFNAAGEYGYEQAFAVIQRLALGHAAMREMYRRMVFNLIARNQDDHTRNIVFLMDRDGRWRLSPAFDITWAYNPAGRWTNRHQMSVNGKRDGFESADLVAVASQAGIKRAPDIIRNVARAVRDWPAHAEAAAVDPKLVKRIGATHRRALAGV